MRQLLMSASRILNLLGGSLDEMCCSRVSRNADNSVWWSRLEIALDNFFIRIGRRKFHCWRTRLLQEKIEAEDRGE